MFLFDRDFRNLSDDENQEYQKIKAIGVNRLNSIIITKPHFYDYPKAVRHYLSLFPNNYLDPADLLNSCYLAPIVTNFYNLINKNDAGERDILNFIKDNKAYFIIGSVFKLYNFGHHGAYIFPEFQLNTDYKVDYLLIGKSSNGFEFIFIELESIYGNITLQNGEFGVSMRKGVSQIDDWQTWIESNFISLRLIFDKFKNTQITLPSEFINYDSTRFHYMVVAGRRSDFSDKTYKLQRSLKNNSKFITHYDKIYEIALSKIGNPPY